MIKQNKVSSQEKYRQDLSKKNQLDDILHSKNPQKWSKNFSTLVIKEKPKEFKDLAP